jgi:quinol monooxygenase YgiN
MSSRPDISLAALDELIASAGFPVRTETLERAWQLTPVEEGEAEEIMIVVTLVAQSGQEAELERAALAFVEATRTLRGALGSTLYRSTENSRIFTLVERFRGSEPIQRHMASDYFRRFQFAQESLLAEPVRATLHRRIVDDR